MTSQRWSRVVSVLVFGLVLATAGSARAQWGFPGTSVARSVSPFGRGLRDRRCLWNFALQLRLVPSGRLRGHEQLHRLPSTPAMPGASGRRPVTTTSFESVSDAVTLVPSWNGSSHRVHRPRLAQPSIPRAAVRR